VLTDKRKTFIAWFLIEINNEIVKLTISFSIVNSRNFYDICGSFRPMFNSQSANRKCVSANSFELLTDCSARRGR